MNQEDQNEANKPQSSIEELTINEVLAAEVKGGATMNYTAIELKNIIMKTD